MWTGLGIAAAGIAGAAMSSNAAGNATQAGVDASGRSIDEQRRQYDTTRADTARYRATGNAANARLAALLGLGNIRSVDDIADEIRGGHTFDIRGPGGETYGTQHEPELMAEAQRRYAAQSGINGSDTSSSPLLRKFTADDLNADPVYQSGLKFGEDQGTGAINARATASGMYDSGATIKALTKFSNDYGSTKAGDARNRFVSDQDSVYNKLTGTSGGGQVATQQVTSAGTNMANNVSNDISSAGNARAAGIVGGANAWGGAINNASMAANNYQSNQRLNALLARYPGAGASSGATYDPSMYAG